jgi:phospholipid transport system transporter-binding protein
VAKTGKTSEGTKPIKLGRDLRIASAAGTYAALAAAAEGGSGTVAIDAKPVEKADAAGVQALLAGRIVLERAGKELTWVGCSTQLRAAAGLLGLAEALGLPE